MQGYSELDYTVAPWLTLYGGMWASSLATDSRVRISRAAAALSYGKFGLDLGYVYYAYPRQ